MYSYRLSEWILFWFIYNLVGYIWETCYVSLKQKKFVNRGFLHGPYLPIYGTGAIVMLFTTMPFRDCPILIFLVGGAAATLLEYVTGAALLAIFKTRYWDYSERWLNVNGHICFKCTVGWCFCSLALVEFIHKPVETFVLSIPDAVTDEISMIFTIVFLIDLVISVDEALHLRKIIISITEQEQVQEFIEDKKEKTGDYYRNRKRAIMLYVLQDELSKLVKSYEDSERTDHILRENPENMETVTSMLYDIEKVIECDKKASREKNLNIARRAAKRNPAFKLTEKINTRLIETINGEKEQKKDKG